MSNTGEILEGCYSLNSLDAGTDGVRLVVDTSLTSKFSTKRVLVQFDMARASCTWFHGRTAWFRIILNDHGLSGLIIDSRPLGNRFLDCINRLQPRFITAFNQLFCAPRLVPTNMSDFGHHEHICIGPLLV